MEKFVIEGGAQLSSTMVPAGNKKGVRIKDTVPGDLRMIRLVFERLGLRTELQGNDVLVPGGQRQIDRGYERIDERLRELGARIERVATEPVHA